MVYFKKININSTDPWLWEVIVEVFITLSNVVLSKSQNRESGRGRDRGRDRGKHGTVVLYI